MAHSTGRSQCLWDGVGTQKSGQRLPMASLVARLATRPLSSCRDHCHRPRASRPGPGAARALWSRRSIQASRPSPGRDPSCPHCSSGTLSCSPHRTSEGDPALPSQSCPAGSPMGLWCSPRRPGWRAEGTARGRGHPPALRTHLTKVACPLASLQKPTCSWRHTPHSWQPLSQGNAGVRKDMRGRSGWWGPGGESGQTGTAGGQPRRTPRLEPSWGGGVGVHPPPFTGQAAASWDWATALKRPR